MTRYSYGVVGFTPTQRRWFRRRSLMDEVYWGPGRVGYARRAAYARIILQARYLRALEVIRRAKIRAFASATYRASIELQGSHKAFLTQIPVSRHIPSAEMIIGRHVQVIMFDENNPRDSVIIGVYTP